MMSRQGISEGHSPADVNGMLASLLGGLEAALAEACSTSRGRPMFAVEGDLSEKLRRVLPGVRFSADDIRKWSAEISS
jgi:hypothetical protein